MSREEEGPNLEIQEDGRDGRDVQQSQDGQQVRQVQQVQQGQQVGLDADGGGDAPAPVDINKLLNSSNENEINDIGSASDSDTGSDRFEMDSGD